MGPVMVKSVLMIAFHYPPMRGSSGIQRTLKFSQHLPQEGWRPLMLCASPRAYHDHCEDLSSEIPPQAVVTRAFALDTARHLSVLGRYPRWFALPDRWVSWLLGAVPAGLRLVRVHRPAAIWSTYPIATAHLAGLALRKLTGLPWIADLRDPMTDDAYPPDPLTRRVYRWIERQTVEQCAVAVCTTPGALRAYATRYPHVPASRFALIENGFDEESFAAAPPAAAADGQPFTLVHSGVIYPSERDPAALFTALAILLRRGAIAAGSFRLVLRATGHDSHLRTLVAQAGVESVVALEPHIPYTAALAEMLSASGLLVLQGASCNDQVPAKIYEYFRARRPVLALTDPAGDTAATMRSAGMDTIAPLDDATAIAAALESFIARARAGTAPLASAEAIAACSRRARSRELARLLAKVTEPGD
ncbi:glycosyltransferase [Pseudoduganella sp. GCM10020061]|uniref:glycosyltransferase n=1 Tax=Pseudoduganella sp. GCM10020061 TaxID=3317345 RepID=UPI0036292C36